MSRTATFVTYLAGLAALAATGSGTLAWAKNAPEAAKDPLVITLRVFDYVHVKRSALLASEGEATRILAEAGVNARWVDCPTALADWDNYPDCHSAWQAHDYSLRVMPKAMVGLLGTWKDALGFASDCDGGPYCWAAVFYDRVMALVDGTTVAAPALLGRVMAHEIGHLLLGPDSHSRTGVMRGNWSAPELSLVARLEMYFTREQSRRMKTRLAEQAPTGQVQTHIADLGRP